MVFAMRKAIVLLFLAFVTAWTWPFTSTPELPNGLIVRDEPTAFTPATGCGPDCAACKAYLGCQPVSKRSLDSLNSLWSLGYDEDDYDLGINDTAVDPLQKRVLPAVDEADIASYLAKRIKIRGRLGLTKTVKGSDLSFAQQKQFSDYQSRNLVIGTLDGFLTGCTILTVVSSKAVYMAHFWQNLGFQNLDKKDPEPANFQQNVANLITGNTPLFYAAGPALDESLFPKDEKLYAAIMTPAYESGQLYFPKLINTEMRTVLTSVLGPGARIDVVGYVAEKEYPEGTPGGQALFEYDADADGEGNGNWRLFYEARVQDGRDLGQNVFPSAN